MIEPISKNFLHHFTPFFPESSKNISLIIREYLGDLNFLRLCYEPYEFYEEIQDKRDSTLSLLRHFTICPCIKVHPKMRAWMENTALSLLKETEAPKHIVSVGPGGSYQEIVMVAKLANMGCRRIILSLIEPEAINMYALKDFFKETISQCQIEATRYPTVKEYMETTDFTPDLLMLIDLTDNWYNPEEDNTRDWGYKRFHQEKRLKKETVIVYNDPSQEKWESTAVCCFYDGSDTLLKTKREKELTFQTK